MVRDLALVGNHFIVGLTKPELSPEEGKLLELLRPSGIILFAHNIDKHDKKWPEKLARLISETKEAAGRKTMFVSIDHEGGKVHRLPEPVTHFPAPWSWSSRADEIGRAMGRELRALGINLNFAPLLDIHSESKNPVIGTRSFASTPDEVIKAAGNFIAALQQEGVLACGKHFPGHGSTTADSHFELPIVECSRDELMEREIVPFRHFANSELKMIMTAHVMYPAFDSDQPATTSDRIINGLLRKELGYENVVISDALEMKALSKIPPRDLPARIIRSGVDLLLTGQPKGQLPLKAAEEMGKRVLDAVNTPLLEERVLINSRDRINAAADFLNQLQSKTPMSAYPLTVLGQAEHQALLADIG